MAVIERMLWLPGVLSAAGLDVVPVEGWQNRGHTNQGDFRPRAVMIHHDASRPGDSPGALDWLISGFRTPGDDNYDAQIWVDRDGVWHVIAAGYSQHAGAGIGWGVIPAGLGNNFSFGVETDHTTGEAWPAVQIEAVEIGTAAICKARGWDPDNAATGHKEYARGRKTDPDGIEMNGFRARVRGRMEGTHVSASGPEHYDDADWRAFDARMRRILAEQFAGWLAALATGGLNATTGDSSLPHRANVRALARLLDGMVADVRHGIEQSEAILGRLQSMEPGTLADPEATAAAVAPHLRIEASP
jgi:hypothetical protein